MPHLRARMEQHVENKAGGCAPVGAQQLCRRRRRRQLVQRRAPRARVDRVAVSPAPHRGTCRQVADVSIPQPAVFWCTCHSPILRQSLPPLTASYLDEPRAIVRGTSSVCSSAPAVAVSSCAQAARRMRPSLQQQKLIRPTRCTTCPPALPDKATSFGAAGACNGLS